MKWVTPTRADLVAASVVTTFGVVSVVATAPAGGASALAITLGVLATAPLALRRSTPFGVLIVISVALALEAAKGYPQAAGALGGFFAAASAAYLTDRRGAILAGVTFVAAALAIEALGFSGPGEYVALATGLVIAVLPTLVGDVLRTLGERNSELEALRDVAAREAVAQDRVRIAREVHDVVGHALAGIALQARAARRLHDRDRERTLGALRQIDEIATSALSETREAVGQIRGAENGAEPGPRPELSDLRRLVDHLQQDDLRVHLHVRGDVSSAPARLQTSAYRIVQEALSNVVKHARPATVCVTIAVDGAGLELEVRDDGRRARGERAAGNGLRGMRERAAECGGELDAGPEPAGGWRVRAELPLPGSFS